MGQTPYTRPRPEASDRLEREQPAQRPLLRRNFLMMAISAALIIAGFILMLGGSSSAQCFNEDIFSARRIVVGPTIAFVGFVAMAIAIIWPCGKASAADNPTDKKSPDNGLV